MSKYEPLWKWISENFSEQEFGLSFELAEKILGFPIDHSFLTSKEELFNYGYEVKKISIKDKNILIKRK